MSPFYTKDGKLLLVDSKLAAEQACCCNGCCGCVLWEWEPAACWPLMPAAATTTRFIRYDPVPAEQGGDCYAYFFVEKGLDESGFNPCDLGENINSTCRVYARVLARPQTDEATGKDSCFFGAIEYQDENTGEWGSDPSVNCEAIDVFGTLAVRPCCSGPCSGGEACLTQCYCAYNQEDLRPLVPAGGPYEQPTPADGATGRCCDAGVCTYKLTLSVYGSLFWLLVDGNSECGCPASLGGAAADTSHWWLMLCADDESIQFSVPCFLSQDGNPLP